MLPLPRPEGCCVGSERGRASDACFLLLTRPAAALDELEADPTVRGVVIASGLQKDVFTAG